MYNVVKTWVSEWEKDIMEEITMTKNKDYIKTSERKCDIDTNGVCDLTDLSILLFYVER